MAPTGLMDLGGEWWRTWQVLTPTLGDALDSAPLLVHFLLCPWAFLRATGFLPSAYHFYLLYSAFSSFQFSQPLTVQCEVMTSFLLQLQVLNLHLMLSSFPSSNAPE